MANSNYYEGQTPGEAWEKARKENPEIDKRKVWARWHEDIVWGDYIRIFIVTVFCLGVLCLALI